MVSTVDSKSTSEGSTPSGSAIFKLRESMESYNSGYLEEMRRAFMSIDLDLERRTYSKKVLDITKYLLRLKGYIVK